VAHEELFLLKEPAWLGLGTSLPPRALLLEPPKFRQVAYEELFLLRGELL